MNPSSLMQYLQRAALDRAFRALATSDPDASFLGFALTDSEKEILRRRDHGVAGLLASAARENFEEKRAQADEPPAGAHPLPVTGRVLPPFELLLQVSAVPSRDEAGAPRLAHFVSLHAAPAPGAPLPPLPAGAPENATPPVRFRIVVAPHAASLPDGGTAVTYAASLLALEADGPFAAPEALPPPASPGERRVDSEAARRAADAVKAAAPPDRYARLIDLAAALEGAGEES